MRKIMSVLDVGTDTTKLVVGEMVKSNIQNEEALKDCISQAFKMVNEKIGIDVTKTIVIVNSDNVEFSIGEAKIGIENDKIEGHDITKVIMESYSSTIPDNMELIEVIRTSFKLDNGEVTRNPLNNESKTLDISINDEPGLANCLIHKELLECKVA